MALNSLSWARARHAECLEKFLPPSSILYLSARKSLKTPGEQQKNNMENIGKHETHFQPTSDQLTSHRRAL